MTALAPYAPRDVAPLVHLATPGVSADVSLSEGCRYELRLAAGAGDVNARLVGTTRGGEIVELGALAVPAGCAGASRFPIALGKRDRVEHVYLEIAGGDLRLRVEAPTPPRSRRFGLPIRVAGASAVLAVAAATGGLLVAAIPQAPTLVAPSPAVAGEVARVAYATHGIGTATYRATSDDGKTLADGLLTRPRGEIAIAIPRPAAHRRVDVSLRVRGPLGDASRAISFPVVPPSARPALPAPVARIAAFSVHRDGREDADGVLASYLAVGDHGVLTITDEGGRVVARAPFSHTGTQRLALPARSERKALVARLEVGRGPSTASASVVLPGQAFPVAVPLATIAESSGEAAPGAYEAPASVEDGTAAKAAAVTEGGSDPIAMVGKAVAGRPFTVAILTVARGMRIRLEDDAGNAVAEAAAPPGARQVTLTPPGSSVPRTYYLTCTYSNGYAQEAVVRSVRVSPR